MIPGLLRHPGRELRRQAAFLLLGVADALYPSPGLGCLSNAELDARLAQIRRRRGGNGALAELLEFLKGHGLIR